MNSAPLTLLHVSRRRRAPAVAKMMLATSLLISVAVFSIGAHAQQPQGDPPGRVARLSEINGQVWLYNPDGNEWVAASRNRPLTSGDRVATDVGARAELQVGSSTLRIDASTELEVVQLDDDHVALQLHDGSAIAHVRDYAGAGQLALSTAEGRFIALSTGTYRFDRTNARSDVTVYAGQARYEGQNSALPVNAGQRAEFWIDSGGVAQYSLLAPVNDAFSAWSGDRDRRDRRVEGGLGQRYVSPEMTGAAELDAYGRWEPNADYGSVWIPTAVAADWAPYSHGHWAWVRPWGWTWVDDAPWGFAPFHYGRWVYLRNNWCWTPGTRVARPVYAPALVAWVGSPRANVSITIGGGPAVGWLPLAPREVYVPSYRVSPRYVQNVNITNVTSVTVISNVYNNPQGPREFENRRAPRGVTVVPANVMAERRPVAPAAAEFRQSPAAREFVNAPGRQAALLAPLVAAPVVLARNPDPRAVRQPPGAVAGAGDRSGFVGRPGGDGRERGERGERGELSRGDRRGPDAREGERAGVPSPFVGQRPGAALPPQAGVAPAAPTNAAAPAAPAAIAPPAAVGARSPSPPDAGSRRPDGFIGGPERSGRFRDRDGGGSGGAINGAPPVAAPVAAPIPIAPAAAVAPPPRAAVVTSQPQPQPQAPPQLQQAPMMRPLPVHRDEDRRNEDRRSEERRMAPPPRGEMQSAPEMRRMLPPPPQQQQVMPLQPPQPQLQPRVERAPPPRPVEAPRPVEMQRQAPPIAQPAPPPPPAPVQRIEPRQEPQRFQGRTDNRGDEPRRGDPREGR